MEKNGRGVAAPCRTPLNPKGAASCGRHVEDLLSRSVLPAGTKGGAPCAPRGRHVVDFMSRLVRRPGQKVHPFVSPPLSRFRARDKRPLRTGTKGPFSTSGYSNREYITGNTNLNKLVTSSLGGRVYVGQYRWKTLNGGQALGNLLLH